MNMANFIVFFFYIYKRTVLKKNVVAFKHLFFTLFEHNFTVFNYDNNIVLKISRSAIGGKNQVKVKRLFSDYITKNFNCGVGLFFFICPQLISF